MPDAPDQPNPLLGYTFNVGNVNNEPNVNFQVNEVNNLDITHIKILEDRLTLILDRNKDKLKRSTDDDFWPWIALLASAIFNIASCLPPVLTSTFNDSFLLSGKAWTRLFDLLALASLIWVAYIIVKTISKYRQLADTISVDELVDMIKKSKYNN